MSSVGIHVSNQCDYAGCPNDKTGTKETGPGPPPRIKIKVCNYHQMAYEDRPRMPACTCCRCGHCTDGTDGDDHLDDCPWLVAMAAHG